MIFREKIVTCGKDFRQGWKNSLYVSRVTITAEKHFYLIQFQFTFSGFSGPRAEKKFHLRSQVFGKFGGVHSTRSDKHLLENIFFGESFIFQSIFVHWNKICSKLLKKSLHGKNFYTDLYGSDWTLKSNFFPREKCVSVNLFSEFFRRNLKILKKNSAGFPKLCSKCPEEHFQDKHVSFRKNCVFPFILDFETKLIRNFASNFPKRVFSGFCVPVETFQSRNGNFLN